MLRARDSPVGALCSVHPSGSGGRETDSALYVDLSIAAKVVPFELGIPGLQVLRFAGVSSYAYQMSWQTRTCKVP